MTLTIAINDFFQQTRIHLFAIPLQLDLLAQGGRETAVRFTSGDVAEKVEFPCHKSEL